MTEKTETVEKKTRKSYIKPTTVSNNVRLVVGIIEELGPSTGYQVAKRAGYGLSWAAMYLNEAVRRNMLEGNNKRPKTYFLPGQKKPEKGVVEKSVFEHSGKTEPLTLYVDESVCAKLKALSVISRARLYGGQNQIVSELVNAEFEKLPQELHGTIETAMQKMEEAEAYREAIPLPFDWGK